MRLNPGVTFHTIIAFTAQLFPDPSFSRYPMTLIHSPRLKRRSSTNRETSTRTLRPECARVIIDEGISYVSTLQSITCFDHAIPSQKPHFTVLETRWILCYSLNSTDCRWRRITWLNIHPSTCSAIFGDSLVDHYLK